MLLNQKIVSILKNYATINPNIVIDEGNLIRTKTKDSDLYSEFVIGDSNNFFDGQIRLYDLNSFLGLYGMIDSPELTIQDKELIVSSHSSNTKITIRQAAESLLDVAKNRIKTIEGIVSFDFPEETLREINNVAKMLQADMVSFESIDENNQMICIKVYDSKRPDGDVYRKQIPAQFPSNKSFSFVFKITQLSRLYQGSYHVDMAESVVGMFTHQSLDLKYWMGQDSDLSFIE